MNHATLTVESRRDLTADVFELTLRGDTSALTRPGQFIDIALDGLFLRRPISVCDWDDHSLKLIIKSVGEGTRRLSHLQPGDALDALMGLGNGFDVDACPDRPLLVGGGVGVPPLFALAKRLIAQGKNPTAILGFNKKEEIFYAREFSNIDVPVRITTVDGSVGTPGFVTDAMPEGAYVCACGPEPMLKAVHRRAGGGQFSFEARMGCGFGACMGCTCQMQSGLKRICKDGPVFAKEDIPW